MDTEINKIYVEFIAVLTNNKVEYSGAVAQILDNGK